MNFKPDQTLKYSIDRVVDNGWINIEDDENPRYWVKGEIILSAHVFINKVHNLLILYLEGHKWNESNRLIKLKEPWTALNLKVIQSIFYSDQLHSYCHFPKEVAEYFSKRLNNVKYRYRKYGEYELYTDNYQPGEIVLCWSKE